jgi:hypothetical protein
MAPAQSGHASTQKEKVTLKLHFARRLNFATAMSYYPFITARIYNIIAQSPP